MQRDARRFDLGGLARTRAEQGAAAGDSSGAEQLAGNQQIAAVLREQRIANLDHPVAQAIDGLLVGARLAEALHSCVRHLQWRQVAVVVQRHGVEDAQGKDHLRLHVDTVAVEAGVDEDRRQLVAIIRVAGILYRQRDRLAAQFAQLQRRNDQLAAAPGAQRGEPAGGGTGFALDVGQAVELTGVEDLEQLVQGLQVRFAEDRGVAYLEGQFEGFIEAQLGAIDTGMQVRGMARDSQESEQYKGHQADHRFSSWRLRCS